MSGRYYLIFDSEESDWDKGKLEFTIAWCDMIECG